MTLNLESTWTDGSRQPDESPEVAVVECTSQVYLSLLDVPSISICFRAGQEQVQVTSLDTSSNDPFAGGDLNDFWMFMSSGFFLLFSLGNEDTPSVKTFQRSVIGVLCA